MSAAAGASIRVSRNPGVDKQQGPAWLRMLVRAIQSFATDPNSVLERQLCMVTVYGLAQPLLLVPGVTVDHPEAVVLGGLVMVIATVAAFILRSPTMPVRLAMIVPLADIIAVGLLRAGSGGATSVFTLLLVLPVISLGVEPGRLPLLIGGPITILAMLFPLAFDSDPYPDGQWIRVIVAPLVLGLTCLSVNELTRRLRSRVRAVQRLRRDQEELLIAAQDLAADSAAASALLRESTNQLASVIDSVTEQSIIAADRTGRIELFNAGAQKMLRVAAHDAIGHSITQFHVPAELDSALLAARGTQLADRTEPPPSTGDRFGALVSGVRQDVGQVRDWTYLPQGGEPIRVQVAVTARRDAAGEIDGFLFVATDVTRDREQAKMKDEFVNLISHELRTPLSSILGYIELIADDEENPLSDEQQTYLKTVERNANRLLRLVSDLLFTAQVESGRFHLVMEDVELGSLITAALETAMPQATARNVTLKASTIREPVIVCGDPVRLGQAIDNLVSNAVKFTPAGGRVAVTLGVTDEPEPRALIAVSDTGLGIPADEVDRLFSRFFRASTATAHAVPGVGLGLTITQAIAAAHRGQIRVASTVGQGTTFILDLPRSAAVLAEAGGSAAVDQAGDVPA